MTYYDNQRDDVLSWLRETIQGGPVRIATGFITLGGLDKLLRTVQKDIPIRIITGIVLGDQDSGTNVVAAFDDELDASDWNSDDIQSLYDRLGDEVSIRGSQSLHAKLFLGQDAGLVGSSNLTESGLRSGIEYNIELSTDQHATAVKWFDTLWDEGDKLTAEFVEAIEGSDHGVTVVDVPITDQEQYRRVVRSQGDGAERVVSHSLAGQIARLDDRVEFYGTDGRGANQTLGTFGAESCGGRVEYLTRLLNEAATVRGVPDFPEKLAQLRERQAPEHNEAIRRAVRDSDAVRGLPVRPTGLAWYLDWYERDPTLAELPNDFEQLVSTDEPKLSLEPWQHQQRAIDAWVEEGYEGVIEMATGTGKTVVGLAAIEQTYTDRKDSASVQVLVVTHTTALSRQWRDELDDTLGVTAKSSDESHGPDDLTIDVVTPQKVLSDIEYFDTGEYDLVVVDEVHHYGNDEGWGRVMDLDTDRMMGLSAELSGEQHRALEEALGAVVFQYKQREAIDDGIIPEYKWQLHPIELRESERDRYDELTQQIRAKFRQIRTSAETKRVAREHDIQLDHLGDYYRLRAVVRSDTPSTWDDLDALVWKRRKVVYESDAAIEGAVDLAGSYHDQGLKVLVFTMTACIADEIDGRIPSAQVVHSKSDGDVEDILESFRGSDDGVLVGVQMLDEGVDVPDADVAINVAAEKTQKQLVQRQGRILRRGGRYVPVFHHFVIDREVDHYSSLGSVDPEIVADPRPVVEERLPTTVGSVEVWDVYRSLSQARLEELDEAASLSEIEFTGDEWWLNIYCDEYPGLFEERIRADVADET